MSTVAARQYNFVDDKANAIPITASRIDAEHDNEITKLNQKALIASSAPASPIAGMLWYDSTNKFLKEYRNSEWVIHGIVHVSGTEPSTPQDGDLWNDITNNIIKKYDTSVWVELANMSFPSGTAYGDIMFTALTTTSLDRLARSGTAGLVLTNGGTSSTPLWGKITLSGATGLFGVKTSVSGAAQYDDETATTDGLVEGWIVMGNSTAGNAKWYTSTDATVQIGEVSNPADWNPGGTYPLFMSVKKGDKWKVVLSATTIGNLFWTPIGS